MTVNDLDISYKFHIQTLRAISVLLVFFYHLKIDLFAKGYLGVDIFFVISGFVITQSIYSNYLETNKIDLKLFYKKRLKRILPNLIFILSITYFIYLIIGPPDITLWNDYLSSILGVSNFYFLLSNKGYFYNIFDNPFAHTWSLGVEEQFYFIYPFLAFLFLDFFKKKNFFLFLLTILILLSLLFAFYFFKINPDTSFYFSPLRFWELGFGCLCYFINNKFNKNSFFSIIFLVLIFGVIFINMTENVIINNLIIIFLSGFFIISYRNISFLENSFFLYLGKISYSFYLWHLPIIFFINIYFEETLYKILISFFITFIFSSITYHFIEKFFINSKKIYSIKIAIPLTIFFTFFFSSLLYLKYFNQDLKFKVRNQIYNINILERKYNWIEKVTFQNIFVGKNEIHRYCAKNSDDNTKNEKNLIIKCLKEENSNYLFFMEGNSYTAQYVNAFNKLKIVKNLYFTSANDNKVSEQTLKNLEKYYKKIFYVTDINNLKKLDVIIKSNIFNSNNIEFIFFNSTPFLYEIDKPAYCISRQTQCYTDKQKDIEKRDLKELNEKLKEIDILYSKVNIFDSYNTLCPDNKCLVYDKIQNRLIYMDKKHLSPEGSMSLMKNLRSFLIKKINIEDLNK